ncbi:hypothetical protein [Alkaliphilus peptidifermentans]|uniref:Uncharacterized protein n=1 Tax=Alkaliphilus peptidifermentans DSM 18978 TaxID=1120976 RepID=A0A1G5GY00_9FIRM|nr:hypothetical protein [Alkaliphilus peptidifermentans]SCY56281.1 hypothetical protein SAMN03080606_01823 [Alkaliphilus peptidifermentans DSM 18978]
MKCDVCKSNISVNYGDAYTFLCKKCVDTEEGHDKSKKDRKNDNRIEGEHGEYKKGMIVNISQAVKAVGIISTIVGILFFYWFIRQYLVSYWEFNILNLLIGIATTTIGVVVYAFGYIIPYIISIDKNLKELKDDLKVFK